MDWALSLGGLDEEQLLHWVVVVGVFGFLLSIALLAPCGNAQSRRRLGIVFSSMGLGLSIVSMGLGWDPFGLSFGWGWGL